MKKLCSESKSEREQAAVVLLEDSTPDTLVKVARILFEEISSQTHAACLDILEKHEVAISLKDVAQDGWLNDVKSEAENFNIVARIVGERYLAYSILLGLQIQSLKNDIEAEGRTLVQFTSDSNMVQVLPLHQFNLQVTSVLLSIGIRATTKMSLPLTESQAIELIGELPLLVAPLFGISLKRLIAIQLPHRCFSIIGMMTPNGHTYMELADFHNIIQRLIQSDLQKLGEEKLTLDLRTDDAETAFNNGEYDRVLSYLQTWPGMLTTLLKSPVKNELSDDQMRQIAIGTRMLAKVYQNKNNPDWAKETLRLGIRYVCDTPYAGALYMELGKLQNETECYGEAIGYLRRALALNENRYEGTTELAKALFYRNKKLCSFLLLKDAAELHPLENQMRKIFLELKETWKVKQFSWPN